MADEATDTTASTIETPATDQQAPEVAAPTDAPAADQAEDSTVLGGKAPEDTADKAAEPSGDEKSEQDDTPAGAPEKYEFALDGVDLDADMLGDAEPILRELNLSNEAANKLLPAANQLVEKARDGTIKQITDMAAEQRADWLKIAKADETIGGNKWAETEQLAAKGLDALGFKEGHPFRQALNETGFGNNRDMIFAFRQLGQMAGEDGEFVRSDAAKQDISAKDILYPSKK